MSAVMTTSEPHPRADATRLAGGAAQSSRYLLWIDGVGAYLLCVGERITIGGPADPDRQSDLTLLANLSRTHATISRAGEGYVFEPHGSASLGNRTISEPTPLADGYTIRLGSNVELKFRLPSVLSNAAALEFVSDHRPVYSVDGVVMMEETCLIGPGRDQHIICPLWSESIVLFRRDEAFYCKSRTPLAIDGNPITPPLGKGGQGGVGGPIHPDAVVSSGSEIRFRIEEVS